MNKRLRKLAEAQLEGEKSKREKSVPEDVNVVIHDLKVHQIELEIQNEELRNAQEALERTKEEYVRLYHDAPVGYLTLDETGFIQKCNRTFLEMIEREDAVGKSLTSYIFPEDIPVFLGRFKAFFNEPTGKSIEVRLGTRPKSRYVRFTGKIEASPPSPSATEYQEETQKILLIVHDIGEQKIAEQKIHGLLKEKDLLLQEVHHRVKNNMNTIIGLLSLQSMKMEGTIAGTALEEAQHRVETMLLIYDSLYHSGSYKSIDLDDYFSDLLDRLESSFAGIGEVLIQGELESIEVEANAAFHLGIICNELITNAYKYAFSANGSGTIRVAVRRDGAEGILLSIADDGRGVPENFDPFTSDGYGIFLIRGMLEQLGGSMEIERLSPGTLFRILVPEKPRTATLQSS